MQNENAAAYHHFDDNEDDADDYLYDFSHANSLKLDTNNQTDSEEEGIHH
jgi:hypothetical protein